jgi:XXXCH domain-containing protein
MGEKSEKRCSRMELADFLASLAQQLRTGVMEAQGRGVRVPEEVEAKIHLEEKKGRFEGKISWRWPSPGEAGRVSGKAAPLPGSLKEIKGRMGSAFAEIKKAAGQGEYPDGKTLKDFVESSQKFREWARPEWQEAMEQFLDHVKNLQAAVDRGEREAMVRALEALAKSMALCHREFK